LGKAHKAPCPGGNLGLQLGVLGLVFIGLAVRLATERQ
jgi:hypothetical protein